jgi:hypothetical protein
MATAARVRIGRPLSFSRLARWGWGYPSPRALDMTVHEAIAGSAPLNCTALPDKE